MNLSTLPLAESQRLQALDATFRALPARGHVSALQAAAGGLGYSSERIVKLYYKWQRAGMEGLSDKRLNPASRSKKTTDEIVERYAKLVDGNQRKDAPAYRVLKAELIKSGMRERDIPSLATLRNEDRKLRLNKDAERALSRYGMVEAARHLPQVLTTRVGLWAGAYLPLDDVWHDLFGRIAKGEKQYSIVRPLQLTIMDLFSGDTPMWGIRPRMPVEGGKFETLKEADTRFLVAGYLSTVGFSPRGTTFLAEHGTAAIRDRVKGYMHDMTLMLGMKPGIVKVDESGIIGNKALMDGMFGGSGKGNPNFKTWLESWHNLLHNETGFIPAQTGMNRDTRPESTNSLLKYTDEMTRLASLMEDEEPGIMSQLALPVMDWHGQLMPTLNKIMERLRSRDWHNLEGWSKCGHCHTEYLLPVEMALSLGLGDREMWLKPDAYMALPGHVRNAVRIMAQGDPYTNTRQGRLSPREAFAKGAKDLVKVPDHITAGLLTLHGDLDKEYFRERPVQKGYITLWDMSKNSGELRYESVLTDPEGRRTELPTGSEWLVCTNPFDLNRAWLFDAKGAFRGTLPRANRVSRLDTDAVKAEMGHKAHRASVLLDGYKDRHAEEATAMQDMRAHNAKLLGLDKKAPRIQKPKAPKSAADDLSLEEIMAAKAAAQASAY